MQAGRGQRKIGRPMLAAGREYHYTEKELQLEDELKKQPQNCESPLQNDNHKQNSS